MQNYKIAMLALLLSPMVARAQKGPLEVRHITVGMTPEQVDTAAKQAGMHRKSPGQPAIYLDPKALGNGYGMGLVQGSGLVVTVRFSNGLADMVMISEEGSPTGPNGEIEQDLAKKWGSPKPAYSNPQSHSLPWWGDPKGVWADYESSFTSYGGQHVSIWGQPQQQKPRVAPPM